MKIEKKSRKDAGSCNFHDGYINGYAYWDSRWDHEIVYEVSDGGNGGIKVRFCQKCLNELLTKSCMDKLME